MKRDGYSCAVSLECNPDVLQAEDESHVLAHLREAVRFSREHMGQ